MSAGPPSCAIAARAVTDFGTLEAGKFADLVVLSADPLADILRLLRVREDWVHQVRPKG